MIEQSTRENKLKSYTVTYQVTLNVKYYVEAVSPEVALALAESAGWQEADDFDTQDIHATVVDYFDEETGETLYFDKEKLLQEDDEPAIG